MAAPKQERVELARRAVAAARESLERHRRSFDQVITINYSLVLYTRHFVQYE